MQIFLLSDYDALVTTNGKDIELTSGCVTSVPNAKIYKIYPIGNKHLLPYCIDVDEEVGYEIADSKLIYLDKVYIKEETEIYTKKFGLTSVEVVCSSFTTIKISEQNDTFKNLVSFPLSDVNIQKIGKCIFIFAKYNQKRYCFLFGNNKKIFSDIIEDYEIDNDNLTLIKSYSDMAKQGLLIKYNLNTFSSDSELIYFENPRIFHDNRLIPFAFLEAIKTKNTALARKYLGQNLNQRLDDEHLIAFFEPFEQVIQNMFIVTNNFSAATLNHKERKLNVYSFTIENDKIVNIDKN